MSLTADDLPDDLVPPLAQDSDVEGAWGYFENGIVTYMTTSIPPPDVMEPLLSMDASSAFLMRELLAALQTVIESGLWQTASFAPASPSVGPFTPAITSAHAFAESSVNPPDTPDVSITSPPSEGDIDARQLRGNVKKRQQRACDFCRLRKIACQPPATVASPSQTGADGPCGQCARRRRDCSFVLTAKQPLHCGDS